MTTIPGANITKIAARKEILNVIPETKSLEKIHLVKRVRKNLILPIPNTMRRTGVDGTGRILHRGNQFSGTIY
jgi:hypothetical protein